jgi:hypothetical protein
VPIDFFDQMTAAWGSRSPALTVASGGLVAVGVSAAAAVLGATGGAVLGFAVGLHRLRGVQAEVGGIRRRIAAQAGPGSGTWSRAGGDSAADLGRQPGHRAIPVRGGWRCGSR